MQVGCYIIGQPASNTLKRPYNIESDGPKKHSWMNLPRRILNVFGWTVDISVPDYPKCIICVAPHTSNWDFILGELAIRSVGRSAGFLMKSSWFFFPLGCLLRAIGGVPVVRNRKKESGSLVETLVNRFNTTEKLTLAIAPEGTRKKVNNWHTGFLRIAYKANVPIALGAIDASSRHIRVTDIFTPTGNVAEDIEAIKSFYKAFTGLKPDNFSTAPQD